MNATKWYYFKDLTVSKKWSVKSGQIFNIVVIYTFSPVFIRVVCFFYMQYVTI